MRPSIATANDCPGCLSYKDATSTLCETCEAVVAGLGQLVPVVPIALFSRSSLLRDTLTYYKSGREVHDPNLIFELMWLLKRFMSWHRDALFSYLCGWDTVAIVPSTQRRDRHPLSLMVAGADLIETKLVRGAGVPGQHRVYDSGLFVADSSLAAGRRVLLIEDVYVSGARSQSCSKALIDCGAEVAGIVALGRRINPDHHPQIEGFLRAKSRNRRPLCCSYDWLRPARVDRPS